MIEEQLRNRGDWLGASCLCRYDDAGFVLAAELANGTLTLSGIGGKVEPGETFRAAAEREVREETGTSPELVALDGRQLGAEATEIPVPPGAGALIAQRMRDGNADRLLWIAVFAGALRERPRPVEKVSYFVVVPPEAFPVGDRPSNLAALGLLSDSGVRPLSEWLPSGTRVTAVLTARAVLTTPGLLDAWWPRTS